MQQQLSDLHILDFYHDAAIALLQLYTFFPRKSNMFVQDIIGEDQTDEFGLHSVRHESCLSTLIWLGEEGLLRHNGLIQRQGLDQAVLTQHCFRSLNKGFEDNAAEAFVHKLYKTARTGSSTELSSCMSHFFDTLFQTT